MDMTNAQTKNINIDHALQTDGKGEVLNCDRNFAKLLGYSPREIIGSNLSRIFKQKDFLEEAFKMQRYLKSAKKSDAYSSEQELIRKNGSSLWCFLETEVIYDDYSHNRYFVIHLMGIV